MMKRQSTIWAWCACFVFGCGGSSFGASGADAVEGVDAGTDASGMEAGGGTGGGDDAGSEGGVAGGGDDATPSDHDEPPPDEAGIEGGGGSGNACSECYQGSCSNCDCKRDPTLDAYACQGQMGWAYTGKCPSCILKVAGIFCCD